MTTRSSSRIGIALLSTAGILTSCVGGISGERLGAVAFSVAPPSPLHFSFGTTSRSRKIPSLLRLDAEPLAPGGVSAAVEGVEGVEGMEDDEDGGNIALSIPSSSSSSWSSSSSPFSPATKRVGINSRGAKMNEIDFTLAPTDVSLSRCYQEGGGAPEGGDGEPTTAAALSLTRALNAASNRAVRRILLSRSWPSAEALNSSLRAMATRQRRRAEAEAMLEARAAARTARREEEGRQRAGAGEKCPLPRPILNMLMKRQKGPSNGAEGDTAPRPTASPEERERQWTSDQIAAFRESYGAVPGYDQAEAYLESILSLATVGEESDRVAEIAEGGTYAGPYARVLSVIQSVGAVLEEVPRDGGEGGPLTGRRRIAKKLIDQDLCLSMLDKISLANERRRRDAPLDASNGGREGTGPVAVPYDAAARLAYDSDPNNESTPFEEFKARYEGKEVATATAEKSRRDEDERTGSEAAEKESEEEPKGRWKTFWSRDGKSSRGKEGAGGPADAPPGPDGAAKDTPAPPTAVAPEEPEGVLLSASEPTVTRQLNVLSNIVQRTLIFGGDQELLVLAETLDADRPAFLRRWYGPDGGAAGGAAEGGARPGAEYLDSLVRLLRGCYDEGVLRDVSPSGPRPLTAAYRNAYGRLTASLIERGSGYVRPARPDPSLSLAMTTTAATVGYLTSTAPPRSAREELGRFARWETAVRKDRENPYPDDLLGTWKVQDVVGTQTIGTTEVSFKPQGELGVQPPMQGLRWRLDPGPTHLDTCTFQVLGEDGAILQYRGFVDRGSRLEARVSKRSVTIQGGVSFLMRDADGAGDMGDNYWDDLVPMKYTSGTTKFVMSRNVKKTSLDAKQSSLDAMLQNLQSRGDASL